ncbi:PH domain-containing protein [Nocardioides cavernaquae]|nr:PH domain-containing protein [Nocardioides cavernaquae]
MSASTDGVTLPHTWRPFGVRMAGIVFGTALAIVCAAAWISFPASVKAEFTILQGLTTLLLIGLFAAAEYGVMRSRAVATETGLLVVNGYRQHRFVWAQVVAVHMPPGAPWAVLDLDDGETCSVMAIQGSDGARAKRAVRELRALLPSG